jgi:hypothetical protein
MTSSRGVGYLRNDDNEREHLWKSESVPMENKPLWDKYHLNKESPSAGIVGECSTTEHIIDFNSWYKKDSEPDKFIKSQVSLEPLKEEKQNKFWKLFSFSKIKRSISFSKSCRKNNQNLQGNSLKGSSSTINSETVNTKNDTISRDSILHQNSISAPYIRRLSRTVESLTERRLEMNHQRIVKEKTIEEVDDEKSLLSMNDLLLKSHSKTKSQSIVTSSISGAVYDSQDTLKNNSQQALVKPKLQRGISRSLSREFEDLKFETKRVDFPLHSKSPTRQIIETNTIYSQRLDKCKIISPKGKLEVAEEKVNQYFLFETIGTGAFGKVVLARDSVSEEEYACKIVSKRRLLKKFRFSSMDSGGDSIRREIAILKKVSDHPNIIKLHEVLDDSTADNLYMFFELCVGGPVMRITVGKHVSPLPEDLALKYFRDIVLGLEYCKILLTSAFL